MSAPARPTIPDSRFPADFGELMLDTVKIEHEAGKDKFGQPTFAQAIEAKCRVDYVQREVRTVDGLVRVSTCTICLAGMYGVQPQDRVTLRDGRQPVIIDVLTHWDDRGPLYQEIMT